MKRMSIILALSLLWLIPKDADASGSLSGRSVGMAGAYTQAARGAESVFWNPANLGFSRGSDRNLEFLSLGVGAYNNAFTLSQYNRYNGEFLTTDDKEAILQDIPADGFSGSAEASILGLGICWGNLAFTISGQGNSRLLFPKDPIEVLFFGNQINDTLVFTDSDGEAYASADFGLSYGRMVWKDGEKAILCGLGVRYVRGFAYQEVIRSQGEMVVLETGITGQGDFAVRSAQGGNGYGLDLGITFKHNQKWSFGVFLANVTSTIKWNRRTQEKGYVFRVDSLLAEDFDVDSLSVDESYTRDIGSFTTHVPLLLRLGISRQSVRSLLTFDLEQGIKQGMGVSNQLKASVGGEYRISRLLALRAGLAVGGAEALEIASGLGLKQGRYYLDIGVAMQKGLWPTRSKAIKLAITNGLNL
jgi:hypothetical protein